MIDLATRMVVGWQLADHMRTSLVVDALQMGIDAGLVTGGAIFHADRGAQYTSTEFTTFCRDNRIRTSHGRTGVCWDNAASETFFAALKNEMYHRYTFTTPEHAHDSPSPSTSRSSTTAADCTPHSATELHTKHLPNTTRQQPQHDQQPEELSKILDTAQLASAFQAYLLDLDLCNDDVDDATASSDAEAQRFEFELLVHRDDPVEALELAMGVVRTGLHAAGASTPLWPKILRVAESHTESVGDPQPSASG